MNPKARSARVRVLGQHESLNQKPGASSAARDGKFVRVSNLLSLAETDLESADLDLVVRDLVVDVLQLDSQASPEQHTLRKSEPW